MNDSEPRPPDVLPLSLRLVNPFSSSTGVQTEQLVKAGALHRGKKKPEDDPYIDVDYRKVGKENESNKEIKIFPVQLKDEAVILFKEYLKKIIA